MIKYKKSRYSFIILLSSIILILLIACASAIGTVKISVSEVISIIFSKIFRGGSISKTNEIIILNIRLPRAFLACFIGMGLSSVGLVYQGIFKNPMADPFVLGTSSGSALGASIAIVLGMENTLFGLSGVAVSAFVGAILTTFVVYNIAKIGNRASNTNLLLAGVAVNFFLSSIISFIMVLDRNQVEKIVFWTLGSLASANYKNVIMLMFVIIPSVILICFFSRDLNIITTGEETASSLGVEVERVKNIMLILSALIVATSVSVSGIIGFVGLIMPHVVRMIIGPDYKKALPFTMLWGASFMVLCDILSRSILSPAEIPVGVITSFFGAPYFIYLLYREKRKVK